MPVNLSAITETLITAKDVTGPIIDKAKSRLDDLGLSGEAAGRRLVAALGGAISVAAFAGAIKGAIDLADHLHDLSLTTGLTVETLGGLGYAASQTGTDLDAVAKAVGRMQVNLVEAQRNGGDLADAFKRLGAFGKEGSEALFAVADTLSKMEDAGARAALAQKAFGKNWQEVMPLLVEGGDNLRRLIAEYERYGGVSTSVAERSDRFNDTLAKLHLVSGALWRQIASSLLPSLQLLADTLLEAKTGGDKFGGTAETIADGLKTIAAAAIGAGGAFVAMGHLAFGGIEATRKLIESLASIKWNDTLADAMRKIAGGGVKDAIKAGIADAQLAMSDAIELAQNVINAKAQAGTSKQQRVTTDDVYRKQAADAKAAADALREYYQTLSDFQKQIDQEQEARAKAIKDDAERYAKYEAAVGKAVEEVRKSVTAYGDENDAIAREIDIIGKDATARERLAATIEYERLKKQALAAQDEESLRALEQQYKRRLDLIDSRSAREAEVSGWTSAFKDLEQIAEGFFNDLATNGSSSFRNLWETFKAYAISAFAKIAAQKVVISIVGALGLGGTAQAAASTLTGGGGGLLNLLGGGGGIGNLFQYGGIFSSGIGASFAGSGLGQALGLSTLAEFSTGATALTALGATVGAAIPILGAALAVASLFGAFAKDPSKVKGQFGISAGTTGFEDNAFTSSRFGNLGFLDAGTQQFSGEAGQTLSKVIAGAFDAIAQRMTPEQIAAATKRVQGLKFPGMEGEYTTEDFLKKYGAQVLQQSLVAAFEELDPAIAKLVGNFKGTADEISAFSNSLLSLYDSLHGDVVKDAAEIWRKSQLTQAQGLHEMGQSLVDLAAKYDGTQAATEALANATSQYRQAVVQTLVQIEQLKKSFHDLFADAAEQIEVSGLTNQQRYDRDRAQVEALKKQIAEATDPAEVERLGKQARDYLLDAWGLLDPAAQALLKSDFLSGLADLDKLITGRLTQIGDTVGQDSQDPFAAVQTALNDSAGIQQQAASKQDAAADKANHAADRFLNAADMFESAAASLQNIHITLQSDYSVMQPGR